MDAVNPIQVQKFLKDINYPTTKQKLVETARNQGADDNIINTLQRLPRDQFNSPNDVSQAIGDLNRG